MYSVALIDIFGEQHLASSEMRLAIVKQMSSLAVSAGVSKDELDIVQMVFTEFYNDNSIAIRLEIAKAVCDSDYMSRLLILRIAEDCASVAQFVLQYSQQLSAIDLIEYAMCGGAVKQLAIASRENLSNAVILSLIEHGTADVVHVLVENPTANIEGHNLRQIYINYNSDARLRELLCNRADLPADLRELIAYDVSKELEKFVVKSNWLNKKQASNVAKKSYEITVIEISETIADHAMDDYINKLSIENRLTPSLILRSVTTGYMKFFESALAFLAGVPMQKLHSLLHNPNVSTRMALFSRSKLPGDLYPILNIAIENYKNIQSQFDGLMSSNKQAFSIQMIKNISADYHNIKYDNQAYLQRMLDCYYIDISKDIAA